MSFNIAIRGLNAVNAQLNTISNNIANADTVGFKSGREMFSALYVNGSGNGVMDQGAQQSMDANGSLVSSSDSLDMAISGKGFFILQDTNNSTKYSRAGYVQVDKDGFLVNNSGLKYQGLTAKGGLADIKISETNGKGQLSGVSIDEKGNVQATFTDGDPMIVGQVALASFANQDKLQAEDGTTWSATSESGAAQAGIAQSGVLGSLHNGSLESSNVDLTGELVNLMSAQRNYQANTKVISTDSSMFTALFQAI